MQKDSIIKLAVVGTAACAAVFALTNFEQPAHASLFAADAEFTQYVAKWGKNYGTVEEFNFRQAQFVTKKAALAEHNAQNGNTYTVGVNKFSDWTAAEYKSILGYKPQAAANKNYEILDTTTAPASIDWRKNGAVNGVKDQGQCGSCWAFSTVASLEGAHFVKTGKLVDLSEQQLVDCSTENDGCDGGSMDTAFDYTSKTPLTTEAKYPYKAQDGNCKKNLKGIVGSTGHTDVAPNNNAQLKAAVAKQPVSIAIEADQNAFQGYNGGVLNSKACGTQLDHGVTIVGYGTEGSQPYWIVRNSWGASWGESGYIRIADVAGAGICGINMAAVYTSSD
jgi:KDEL-tailed cysteine endopeptidase